MDDNAPGIPNQPFLAMLATLFSDGHSAILNSNGYEGLGQGPIKEGAFSSPHWNTADVIGLSICAN